MAQLFGRISTLALAAVLATPAWSEEEKALNVYNWSEYIGENTIAKFEEETGISVKYDTYGANDELDGKLRAGKSGYDIVVPTTNFFAKQLRDGVFQKIDKAKLTNYGNLDAEQMKRLEPLDPGNQYAVPYMRGTNGIGVVEEKVKKALGDNVDFSSLDLVFKKENAEKLAKCGIAFLDSPDEVFPMMLNYIGKPGYSTVAADYDAAVAAFNEIRPSIKYFHSEKYRDDLAKGSVCAVIGYSGDIMTSAGRAAKGVTISYHVPKEGTVLWFDVMAIPADAPHPDNAHKFINFILKPDIFAEIVAFVGYVGANKAAVPLLSKELQENPGLFPSKETEAKLFGTEVLPAEIDRIRTRAWTKVKTRR